MKLEEQIKQQKFRNQFHKLAVNIIFTHSRLMAHFMKIFDKYDITPNQYNILRILRGQYPKPATVNLLKERMLDKMSDASRMVERLRIKGFVERAQSVKDRRMADVIITDKGLKILEQIDMYNNEFDSFFTNLSEQEAESVNFLFDKLHS